MFILALGILIVLDRGLRSNTYLLVEFFVAFLSDGLMLLINWKLVEIIPETMSGRALGCATASLSGILYLSVQYIAMVMPIIGSHIIFTGIILIRMGIESIYGWISLYMYHPLTVSLIHFTCISIATIVTVALLK